MSNSVWIKTRRSVVFAGNGDVERVETRLQSLFQGGYPVLFSSARGGMSLIFQYFFQGDVIRIFPYASQCVVNSINITGKSASTSLPGYVRDVNYNQWGIVLNKQENLFLSDCADSFYPIGGKVCDLNSRFEVWSLPKILGTTFGGVIWCRDLSDAQSLRNLRNTFPRENLLYEIYHDISKRLGGKFYFNWEKRKFNRPNLNFHQINELDRILFDWNAIYRERSELFLEQFTRIHNSDRAKAVKVLSENKGVIPVVIDNLGSTKSRDGTMLHRILPDGFCEKIEICAYQSRIKRRRNYR